MLDVVWVWCFSIQNNNYLRKVFLQILKTKYKTEVLDELRAGKLTEEMEKILQDVAADVANRFKA